MSSEVSAPFVRDLKLSGFKPSTGMMSFAYLSHDPDFPSPFSGTGRTSFGPESSSLQQVFSQVSFGGSILGMLGGAGIFVMI
jgi:hypothetical protein